MWLEREPVFASEHVAMDQARRFEHPDVLRRGGERHVERRRQLGDANLAPAEAFEHLAAHPVPQGPEGPVEDVPPMLNHQVECYLRAILPATRRSLSFAGEDGVPAPLSQ